MENVRWSEQLLTTLCERGFHRIGKNAVIKGPVRVQLRWHSPLCEVCVDYADAPGGKRQLRRSLMPMLVSASEAASIAMMSVLTLASAVSQPARRTIAMAS
jgi:hypothetical protein